MELPVIRKGKLGMDYHTYEEAEKYVSNQYNSISKCISVAHGSELIPMDKPHLKENHTAEDVKIYLEKLKQYESHEEKRIPLIKCLESAKSQLESYLQELAEEISGLYDIPKEYREKVKSLAWEKGHSLGYHEYYLWLEQLVNIFK